MIILKRYLNDFTDSEYSYALSLISQERQNEILAKKQESARKSSVLGEFLARKGINQLTGIDLKDIIIEKDEKGKPFAKGLNINFSISHSGDLVVCAISEGKIGIDCEYIREVNLKIARHFFDGLDKRFIFEIDDVQEQNIRFFKVWTAKEAYFKYLGTGITVLNSLKSIPYEELKENCTCETLKDYMITVYSEI